MNDGKPIKQTNRTNSLSNLYCYNCCKLFRKNKQVNDMNKTTAATKQELNFSSENSTQMHFLDSNNIMGMAKDINKFEYQTE